MLKLAIASKILVPAPSEVSLSKIVSPKIAVFRPFFGRKWSLTAKPSNFDPIVLYIIGKLCIWRFWNSGGKSFFDHLWSARIFGTHPDWIATLIWFLVLWLLSAVAKACLLDQNQPLATCCEPRTHLSIRSGRWDQVAMGASSWYTLSYLRIIWVFTLVICHLVIPYMPPAVSRALTSPSEVAAEIKLQWAPGRLHTA